MRIMNIRNFDYDYSRRVFMEKTAAGFGGAGVLTALWPEVCRSSDIAKAYPEELYDIEAFTKGRVKVGDVIDEESIDLIQDLVDPILFQEVKQDRRKFFIQPTPTAIETLFPPYFLDATIRNQGQAMFDNIGNVYTKDGKPWIGGLPFPDPQTGVESIANITLAWGRHDKALFALPALVMSPDGDVQYEYDFIWAEQQCTGLVHPDAPSVYLSGHEDETRLQCIWFTYTLDVKGHAFLSIWKYDQRQIPILFGYLPNFKRVRRFPANQRFEPYMAGMNLYLSDAHAAGDPMLTWGNYKIIYRGPFIGSTHYQWLPGNDNWIQPLVGGQQDQTYFYVGKSLIPEVIVFEGEPVGYPNAPVSKRRVYMDARNSGIVQSITYDRHGEVWKSFEGGAGQFKTDTHEVLTPDGRPEHSGHWLISHDVQTSVVTRIHLGEKCRGDWRTALDPDEDVLNNYMTVQALRRLGT
jgi:hypothetical protein